MATFHDMASVTIYLACIGALLWQGRLIEAGALYAIGTRVSMLSGEMRAVEFNIHSYIARSSNGRID